MSTYAVNAILTIYLTVEVEAASSEAADIAALDAIDRKMQEYDEYDEYTAEITGANRLVTVGAKQS